jgi:hypothetical protein
MPRNKTEDQIYLTLPADRVAHVVESLSSKCEGPSSKSTAKQNKANRRHQQKTMPHQMKDKSVFFQSPKEGCLFF